MQKEAPAPISAAEHRARLERSRTIARRFGFEGIVEYRHVFSGSGGAQYGIGSSVNDDVLVVDAKAFERDAAGDDFSLEAMIAHERGHQILCRHVILQRNLPRPLSGVTEEVLASLIGASIIDEANGAEMLVMKALGDLVERGVELEVATAHVTDILKYLESVL